MITTYAPSKNPRVAKNARFKIVLPAESCGILLRGENTRNIESITVKIKKQDAAENGELAAVIIDNEPTARIVLYNKLDNNQIVLLDPNKFEAKYPHRYQYNPNKRGDDHIILTAAEAATRLKILGVVDSLTAVLK